MTDTQAERLARARLLRRQCQSAMTSEEADRMFARALQSEREAAAAEARPIVEAACRYCLLNGTKKTQAHKDLVDAVQALFDRQRLASPAPQDDLEGDVKHGNAEYFRAALAHAAAEARRAALEEAALLILDCNTLRGDKLADILATGIRALASPAPQEKTR